MAANKMDEILKHFPDLEKGWKEMEEKLKAEPAEREMLSLKYRERLEREMLKENLPEPEFTKAKRAESDSKVMKANAPEKLYITNDGKRFNDKCHSASTEKYVDNDIEYTRTDAFIERAVIWISNNCYIPHATLEDFKNYMKGE